MMMALSKKVREALTAISGSMAPGDIAKLEKAVASMDDDGALMAIADAYVASAPAEAPVPAKKRVKAGTERPTNFATATFAKVDPEAPIDLEDVAQEKPWTMPGAAKRPKKGMESSDPFGVFAGSKGAQSQGVFGGAKIAAERGVMGGGRLTATGWPPAENLAETLAETEGAGALGKGPKKFGKLRTAGLGIAGIIGVGVMNRLMTGERVRTAEQTLLEMKRTRDAENALNNMVNTEPKMYQAMLNIMAGLPASGHELTESEIRIGGGSAVAPEDIPGEAQRAMVQRILGG